MNRSSNRFTPSLESLDERINLSASPQPVLMVIANQDYFYRDYAEVSPRVGGMLVGLGDGSVRSVKESIATKPADPQAAGVVFVGGWGSSMYQYG